MIQDNQQFITGIKCQSCNGLLEEICGNPSTWKTENMDYFSLFTHYFQCTNPVCSKKFGIDKDGVIYQLP